MRIRKFCGRIAGEGARATQNREFPGIEDDGARENSTVV